MHEYVSVKIPLSAERPATTPLNKLFGFSETHALLTNEVSRVLHLSVDVQLLKFENGD
jgi:hypothetical protein